MASEILDRIGTYIKENNTYFDSFLVNGVQLENGEVIQFTDGQEKQFIGIGDNRGTAGYIRYNPKITHQSSDRKISSARSSAGQVKQCRLVAYSWNKEITSEALLTKLATDLSLINFTATGRAPSISIKNSNHQYTDNVKEEFKKEMKDIGSYGFVCVSIDFDLKYWSTECSICEVGDRIPMAPVDTVQWGRILGTIQDQDDLIALLEAERTELLAAIAEAESNANSYTDAQFLARPRVVSITTSAAPTPNADVTDQYNITALGSAAVFGAPTGTPRDGQKLIIRTKSNGVARALTYNPIFNFASDDPAIDTAPVSGYLYQGYIYNSAAVKWDCVAQKIMS